MKTTRRGFLAAGAAAAYCNLHAQDKGHDHGHDHQVVPSDPTLRVKALESLLVEKGLVDPAALDALIDTYENKVGPHVYSVRFAARELWGKQAGPHDSVYLDLWDDYLERS